MILDHISRLSRYEGLIPGAERIASAYSSQKPAEAGCEVREKRYATKTDDQCRFEVHDHTIDLMIARNGAEVIHICSPDKLTPAETLKDDGRKMDGPVQGSAIVLEAGHFCAIFPGEAHAVGSRVNGQEGDIDKWVVKVRLQS